MPSDPTGVGYLKRTRQDPRWVVTPSDETRGTLKKEVKKCIALLDDRTILHPLHTPFSLMIQKSRTSLLASTMPSLHWVRWLSLTTQSTALSALKKMHRVPKQKTSRATPFAAQTRFWRKLDERDFVGNIWSTALKLYFCVVLNKETLKWSWSDYTSMISDWVIFLSIDLKSINFSICCFALFMMLVHWDQFKLQSWR